MGANIRASGGIAVIFVKHTITRPKKTQKFVQFWVLIFLKKYDIISSVGGIAQLVRVHA